MTNAQTVLVWLQAGGQMAKLVETTLDKVKDIAAAAGASAEEQDAALDRTHAILEGRIAREQAIVDADPGDEG